MSRTRRISHSGQEIWPSEPAPNLFLCELYCIKNRNSQWQSGAIVLVSQLTLQAGRGESEGHSYYNAEMLRGRVLSVALLVIAVVAFGRSTPPSDEVEIHAFLNQFITAFDNLDWERFRTCFADDATVIHPALFSHRLDGRANFEPAWQRVFEKTRADSGKSQPPYMDLKPQDIKIQMLDRAAVVTFHLDRGGSSVGRRTLVLRKDPEGWKIVH